MSTPWHDVQDRLAALGFPVGPIDGKPGNMTAEAVSAALWSLETLRDQIVGTPPEGELDPETLSLLAELERDEGRVLHAYADSLGYLTIGIGRLIDKRRGGGISNAEADLLKMNDIAKVRAGLDAKLPWWRSLDPVRQRAIQNMAFQLGLTGLLGFRATLAAVKDGDFVRAAANMRRSKWAKQTPARAERVIRMMEKGEA
jgi:lysozyme